MHAHSSLVVLATLNLYLLHAQKQLVPPQYRISEKIFAHYNEQLIPKASFNQSVRVHFSMELYQIIEVNEPQQFLMLNSWIVERWLDPLLRWDPAEFEGLAEVHVPYHKIWLPDTTLYNSLVMEDKDTRRLLTAKLTSTQNGTYVELLYPTIYKLSCNLDLRFFPFDIQVCKLIFGSWTFDNTYIDYFAYNETHAIGTANCIENEGWFVLGTTVTRRVEKYACCPNNYTLLDFYLHMQRKPLYYVINLITPTSIITLISIVGFFSCSSINELREEKISLGITTLLSMSILIFMVSDKMPSTSSFIPLIGWFYTAMILLISFSTLLSSVIIYVQKQGILGKPPAKETMKWARFIGRLVWMEIPLLMKQAYAHKAREERLKKSQKMRKESIWQKVYKISKKTQASPKNGTPEKTRKSIAISQEVLKINGTSGLSEYAPMQNVDDDEPEPSFMDDIGPEDLDFPPSKFLHKTMPENHQTPRSARNLAELEFDWLAAVIERVCLIVFIFFFILMSFGINSIGLYYWWTAQVHIKR